MMLQGCSCDHIILICYYYHNVMMTLPWCIMMLRLCDNVDVMLQWCGHVMVTLMVKCNHIISVWGHADIMIVLKGHDNVIMMVQAYDDVRKYTEYNEIYR